MSGKKAEERAIVLLEAAEICYPRFLSKTSSVIRLLSMQIGIQDLVFQKEKCIVKMSDLAGKIEEYNIYQSIPGIAINTAVRLIAEIRNIRRFDNNKQLNAYAGIDIRVINQGNSLREQDQ